MENRFDKLAKALAGEISRREALRQAGGVLAGALLASLGLRPAWGQSPRVDCVRWCEEWYSGRRRGECLRACAVCAGDWTHVCESLEVGDGIVCCFCPCSLTEEGPLCLCHPVP
jgi:hypothetical protein